MPTPSTNLEARVWLTLHLYLQIALCGEVRAAWCVPMSRRFCSDMLKKLGQSATTRNLHEHTCCHRRSIPSLIIKYSSWYWSGHDYGWSVLWHVCLWRVARIEAEKRGSLSKWHCDCEDETRLLRAQLPLHGCFDNSSPCSSDGWQHHYPEFLCLHKLMVRETKFQLIWQPCVLIHPSHCPSWSTHNSEFPHIVVEVLLWRLDLLCVCAFLLFFWMHWGITLMVFVVSNGMVVQLCCSPVLEQALERLLSFLLEDFKHVCHLFVSLHYLVWWERVSFD